MLDGITGAMEIWSAEQFGPLVPIAHFRELGEIDRYVRSSPYGQQISIFGRDPKALASLIDTLVNQLSRINVNTQCRRGPDAFPFTGRRDSAEGTLSIFDALRAFSIRAAVTTAATRENEALVSEIVSARLSGFLNTDFIF